MNPDRVEVGDYAVVYAPESNGWRVIERFGSHRILRRVFRTSASAVKRAAAMQAQRDREQS